MEESQQSGNSTNGFLQALMENQIGSPLYFRRTNPNSADASNLTFDKYFNPDLQKDSTYFKALADVMKCVEKHAGTNTD